MDNPTTDAQKWYLRMKSWLDDYDSIPEWESSEQIEQFVIDAADLIRCFLGQGITMLWELVEAHPDFISGAILSRPDIKEYIENTWEFDPSEELTNAMFARIVQYCVSSSVWFPVETYDLYHDCLRKIAKEHPELIPEGLELGNL